MSFAINEAGLPSFRVAGSQAGEGNENARILANVLVDNPIVRTEVFVYGGAVAATADGAAAEGDAVERSIQDAAAAGQS